MKVTPEECEIIFRSKKQPQEIVQILVQLFAEEENFEAFCRFIFPNAFSKPFAKCHKELICEFDKFGNYATALPRGFGKSTIIGLGWVLHRIAYKKKKYIVYTSQNHRKSVTFVEAIHQEIRRNKRYAFLYGKKNIKGAKDEETGIDRQDIFDIDNIRIEAVSFEKNIRGLKYGSQRPDLIILDDIESDDRVINPDLRRKDIDKLNKEIIPALDAETGEIKMVGTIIHQESILIKKINLWSGKIFRAIYEDGTLLWPEVFDKEKLDKIKNDIGSAAFQSEYLNNPIDDTSAIIKRDWIVSCFDETLSFGDEGKFEIKVQGVDFAFGDRVTSDKSAFVGVGKNPLGYTLISCFTKKGMSVMEQFDYIEYLQGTNNWTDNALEENSIRSMSKELKRYNFPYTLFWTGSSDATAKKQMDPEWNNKRHTIGKTSMIHRLATIFEKNFNSINEGYGRYFRIPYKTERDKEIAGQILDECSTYALSDGKLVEIGIHGDIPIALAYAFERIEMEKFEFEFGMLEV